MVKLPENPMMPRLFDERVGYFRRASMDFGRDEQKATQRTFIARWRLEKKDPNAEISEPVKPIVYYIDSATPVKWRPYMIKPDQGMAAGIRGGRIQECDHRKDAHRPKQKTLISVPRMLAIRWSVAAVDDRERCRAAHSRSANGRDPGLGHPVLSQRDEPG